jgi:hypothetical protein
MLVDLETGRVEWPRACKRASTLEPVLPFPPMISMGELDEAAIAEKKTLVAYNLI